MNAGWKRINLDRQHKPSRIGMKPMYLIFCADGWLVKRESLKRFVHEIWEEFEF